MYARPDIHHSREKQNWTFLFLNVIIKGTLNQSRFNNSIKLHPNKLGRWFEMNGRWPGPKSTRPYWLLTSSISGGRAALARQSAADEMKTDQVWLAASAAFVESHVGSALTDPNVNEWQPLCFVFLFFFRFNCLYCWSQVSSGRLSRKKARNFLPKRRAAASDDVRHSLHGLFAGCSGSGSNSWWKLFAAYTHQ